MTKSPLLFWLTTLFIFTATIAMAVGVIHHIQDKIIFGIITGSGAMGGILYATRQDITNPHIERLHRYSLGYWTDILGGIGGAYIIFLLLPFDFNQSAAELSTQAKVINDGNFLREFNLIRELIRIMAVSLLGGYGGRALMARAQESLGLKGAVEDLAVKVESQQKLSDIRAGLESLTQDLLFDINHKPTAQDVQRLKTLLSEASSDDRYSVFLKALSARRDHAIHLLGLIPKDTSNYTHEKSLDKAYQSHKKDFMEAGNALYASEVIFEALYTTKPEKPDQTEKKLIHRYLAQMAYAKKDYLYATNTRENTSHWLRIKKDLEQAIDYRQQEMPSQRPSEPGTEDDNFGYYELNLAICLMEMDEGFKANRRSDPDTQIKIDRYISKAREECQRRGVSLEEIYPINFWKKLNQ